MRRRRPRPGPRRRRPRVQPHALLRVPAASGAGCWPALQTGAVPRDAREAPAGLTLGERVRTRAGGRLPPGPSAPGRAAAAGRRVLRRRSWPPGPSSPPGRCPVSVWAGDTLGTLSAARPRPARGSAPRVRLPETRLWLGGRRSAPLLARLRPGRARRLPPLPAVLSATTCPQTLSPSVETQGPPRAETQASGLQGPRPPCPALAASSAVWGARAGPVPAHTSLSRRPGQARCPDLVARRSPDPPLNL